MTAKNMTAKKVGRKIILSPFVLSPFVELSRIDKLTEAWDGSFGD